MQGHQSFPTRIYHGFLALLFAFAYRSSHSSFVGISLSSWIKLLSLVPLLVTLARGMWGVPTLLAILPFLCVSIVYWRASQRGYVKFVPDLIQPNTDSIPSVLPPDQHVKMWATGLFEVEGLRDYALLRPAEYWQVPLGTHIFMVRVTSQRFKYQILDPANIRAVRLGTLLFSRPLRYSVAITFVNLEDKEPETQFSFADPPGNGKSTGRERTFYLTFEDRLRQQTVSNNIAQDALRRLD